MQFLKNSGYTEMDVEGTGLIMSDAAIEFKTESFYGDTIKAFVKADHFSRVGFDLYYKLQKETTQGIIAIAKTGMICYNYDLKKVVSLPARLKEVLSA